MLRTTYHEALDDVNGELIRLVSLLSDALKAAIRSLLSGDTSLAAKIIGGMDDLNDLQRKIDSACVELIWKQQPVAGELRQVAAMLEIAVDADRISHYILEIAKDGVRLAEMPVHPPSTLLEKLADVTTRDVMASLTAFRERDAAKADIVLENGDDIEETYRLAIGALQSAMRADAQTIEAGTTMLFVLAALVRIGEHAWSIARHVKEML
jgi:phosphate transport system protein